MLKVITPFFQQVVPKPHLFHSRSWGGVCDWRGENRRRVKREAGFFVVMLDPSIEEVKIALLPKDG